MADAQILLDTSLRPSTLAINLLLDNVKHTQILQEKVSLFCVYSFIVQKLFNNDLSMFIFLCISSLKHVSGLQRPINYLIHVKIGKYNKLLLIGYL